MDIMTRVLQFAKQVPEVKQGIDAAFQREFHNTFWHPRCYISEVLVEFGIEVPPILILADEDELRRLLRLVKRFIELNSPGEPTMTCAIVSGTVRIIFRTNGNHASLFSARLDFLQQNSLAIHSLLGAYLCGLEHFWQVKWEVKEEKKQTVLMLQLKVK